MLLTLPQLQEELQKILQYPQYYPPFFLWAPCSRQRLMHPTVMGLQLLFVDDNSGCSRSSLRVSSILPQHPCCLPLSVTLLATQRLCSVLSLITVMYFTFHEHSTPPEGPNTKASYRNCVNSLCAVGNKKNIPLRSFCHL